jgi:hypothetical protein
MSFFFLTFKLGPFQIHSQLKESIHLSIHMPTGNPIVKEKLYCLVTLNRLTIRVSLKELLDGTGRILQRGSASNFADNKILIWVGAPWLTRLATERDWFPITKKQGAQ